MKKAIEIIEPAPSYYLLSKDGETKPMWVGSRIKLEYCLQDVQEDMIIATTGNDSRCIIIVDFSSEETLDLVSLGDAGVMELKAKN